MIKAKPGDLVGWPPDDPVDQWVVVDITGGEVDGAGDEIAVCRHRSDLEERNLAAVSLDSLVVIGQSE